MVALMHMELSCCIAHRLPLRSSLLAGATLLLAGWPPPRLLLLLPVGRALLQHGPLLPAQLLLLLLCGRLLPLLLL